jgi:hypothetical protein
LSDVPTTDADRKIHNQSRENKTKLIISTHKADFLNNVEGQPFDNGNDEICPYQHPCTNDFKISFGDCISGR